MKHKGTDKYLRGGPKWDWAAWCMHKLLVQSSKNCIPVLGPGLLSISPDKMRRNKNNNVRARAEIRYRFLPLACSVRNSTHLVVPPVSTRLVSFLHLLLYDIWWQHHNPMLLLHWQTSIIVVAILRILRLLRVEWIYSNRK